ncbi:GfV-B2-ORF1 [Ichnoviriform fumiferanae]|uniref:protein-tyrosine-phosphatase n=1 Tax=Ichnoviriform fumiferanae TaxID=419435 RepID=A2PZQ3_9VIRU|nr:GfV-B2-ORF1 [Ichnoviriform fumiferanae]BAF45475.1 GfV-B2-ORF1 [Ichnoviriform fumiferanae]
MPSAWHRIRLLRSNKSNSLCCFRKPIDDVPYIPTINETLNRDYATLEIEYEELVVKVPPTVEAGETCVFSTEAFDNMANKKKNRYENIPCWDHTRVILPMSGPAGCTDSDYIHANYVNGPGWKNKFIATQAPMPNTIIDFLNMIWQNRCPIIVVLTDICEDKESNMYSYWSTTKGVRKIGKYTVMTTDIKQKKNYTKYSLEVENAMVMKERRSISLFHYTDWEIHGIPKYIKGFLKLISNVNEDRLKNLEEPSDISSPIVVHCNAGVSRTGTYCVIDICLDDFSIFGEINVLDTVRSVRAQRHSSVFSANQYAFIFETLKEAVKKKNIYY